MGHQVTSFDDALGLKVYQTNLLARSYRKLWRRPAESHRKDHVEALIREIEKNRPEIVIILKGLYLGPHDIQTIRRTGAWTVNINHDDFFSANRNNWTALQRSAVSQYDYVFTTREMNVEEVHPLNPNVEFFPFAYYPRIHRPITLREDERIRWNSDVVFVGTWERERCRLLENLVQQIPAKYAIYGGQWDRVMRKSPLRPFLHGPIVMDDMAKALGRAKVSLAFLRKENRDDYTQRSFEIPACGGVLLAERSSVHKSLYMEGHEAEFFDPNSSEELAAKVSLLLADGTHREALREAGHATLIRQRHTYQDRLQRLIDLYFIYGTAPAQIAVGRPEHKSIPSTISNINS